jgi:hypothetical protein
MYHGEELQWAEKVLLWWSKILSEQELAEVVRQWHSLHKLVQEAHDLIQEMPDHEEISFETHLCHSANLVGPPRFFACVKRPGRADALWVQDELVVYVEELRDHYHQKGWSDPAPVAAKPLEDGAGEPDAAPDPHTSSSDDESSDAGRTSSKETRSRPETPELLARELNLSQSTEGLARPPGESAALQQDFNADRNIEHVDIASPSHELPGLGDQPLQKVPPALDLLVDHKLQGAEHDEPDSPSSFHKHHHERLQNFHDTSSSLASFHREVLQFKHHVAHHKAHIHLSTVRKGTSPLKHLTHHPLNPHMSPKP